VTLCGLPRKLPALRRGCPYFVGSTRARNQQSGAPDALRRLAAIRPPLRAQTYPPGATERAEHIAEWIRLTEAKQKEVLFQVETKPLGGRWRRNGRRFLFEDENMLGHFSDAMMSSTLELIRGEERGR
jgi:hypothetical protein